MNKGYDTNPLTMTVLVENGNHAYVPKKLRLEKVTVRVNHKGVKSHYNYFGDQYLEPGEETEYHWVVV